MSMATKKKKTRRRAGINKHRPTTSVRHFRANFAVALELDGRSLRQFARDTGMSAAYISIIRSGNPKADSHKPMVPGLDAADLIAISLKQQLHRMLLPPEEFLLTIFEHFGSNLKLAMKHEGYSARLLAEDSDVYTQAIADYLTLRRLPTVQHAKQLARALDWKLDELRLPPEQFEQVLTARQKKSD